jgi:cytoskeleton protein RodZ
MTEEIVTSSTSTGPTAGALLRQYREQLGIAQEALAQLLRVAPSKLKALENDQLDQLPDAMFARALALAVCRHLKVDAKPVLDLLPTADASRLAVRDERGLDYPLDRPSFLPQSALASLVRFFTPMRAAAVAVFVLAVGLFFFTDTPQSEVKPAADSVDVPVAVPAASDASAPAEATQQGHMVVTSVQSPAIAAAASAATQPALGASDAR